MTPTSKKTPTSNTNGASAARSKAKATPQESAQRFERIRRAHQREVAEDYVEMIAELIAETGEARAVDLAGRFGVTAPTVNATIQRLAREGLVVSQPYRSIFLTEEGRALANTCAQRHAVVRDFLISIGVDPDTAEGDAEGLEHHVSEATLNAFRKVIEQQK